MQFMRLLYDNNVNFILLSYEIIPYATFFEEDLWYIGPVSRQNTFS